MSISQSLAALVTLVIAHGKVDTSEVEALEKEFYADGKIDREEVEAAFQINDAVSNSTENDAGWPALFAKVVSDHICEDGEVSQEEAEFLTEKLMADGGVDAAERLALEQIRAKATKGIFPAFDNAMKSLGI